MELCKIKPELPVLKDKDINVVRSLVKDSSWIVAAVDNLRVVEKFLKDEEFEENKKSSNSINNIISCLQTLDNCRLKLHEELEIQSIRGFVIKQTYLHLPKQIREMIEGAVGRAKTEAERHYKKDEDEKNFLDADLLRMRCEILNLEDENIYLPVKQRKLEDQESEVIDEFNLRLQYKLELKEKLRKLREDIRKINQNIVYTEATILKMKDDLIVQRTAAQTEMEFYDAKIEEMKKKRDMWLEKVNTVKPDYTDVMTKLKTSEKIIENMKYDMKNEGHKISTTKRLKGTYQNKMMQEDKTVYTLFERKDRILAQLSYLKEQLEYDLTKKIHSNREVEMLIVFEKSALEELKEKENGLAKVFLFFQQIEEGALKNWKTHKDILDNLQEQLMRLEKELFDIMSEQTEMLDTTKWMDDLLEDRLQEMKLHIKTLIDTLNLKKKARMEIEEIIENILKGLEEVKLERENFESDSQFIIKELQNQYRIKSEEVKQLQKDIRKTVTSIKYEVGNLKSAQDDYDDGYLDKIRRIEEIEENAVEQEQIFNEINQKYQELSNPFKDLEMEYNDCLKTYTSIYRRHSYDRFLLNDLISSTSNTEKELLKQQKKKEKLENSMKRLNDKYFKLLNKNQEEVNELEGEIYKHVCRLKFIKLENKFLIQQIKEQQHQSEEIDEFNKDQSSLKTLLEELLKKLRRGFIKKQRKIEEIEALALERDTPFIDQFSVVLDVMNFNIQLVTSVLNKIEKEIGRFNAKWGNIKNMRPTEESGDSLC